MEPEKTSGAFGSDDLVSLKSPGAGHRDIGDGGDSRENSLTDEYSDEESICRSPTKSPKKVVRKLVQGRDLAISRAAPEDGAMVACGSGPAVQANLPTDADFQFKEPKFRKKKFIFHPFTRAADNSCVPDPDNVYIHYQ